MKRILCLALSVALTIVSVARPAGAVVPGANGRIVFARAHCTSTCSTWQIVAADANDTNETVLAGPYSQDVFDEHFIANWSPDAKSVIFMVNQGIWQVNADGSNRHLVWSPPADGSGLDDGPTFTPDGRHIVFTRCCPQGYGYSLWMINSDGTGLRDVTSEPVVNGDGPADTTPQVSPDGKHILFNRCFPDQPCAIATVTINGTHLHQLTDNSQFATEYPNWSPDSTKIVFTKQANGTADIATINSDGTGLTQLTDTSGRKNFSFDPCYSSDGTKIMFAHYLSTGGIDLFTMNPDGSGVTQVTRTAPAFEDLPQWASGA